MTMASDTTYDRMIGVVVGNYKIERLLATDEFGPVFAARDSDGGSYRLRVLPVRPPASGPSADSYLARFQQQAEHLALLRHPQVLPLIDFGIFRGSPFLVWPHQPMRSLTGLLAESGPLDPITVGRYVSQIADALDYAHRHETLHRNLSTDCVLLHLNGQLVVADFGVRRIFELTASEAQVASLAGASDASAPEQIMGGRVYLYTDVYALGALTFSLLTGAPIFTGHTRDDVAQQHVYAQTPSLRARRPGLPAGLEAVIARALAKNPDQRYQHATAFSRAYLDVLALANGAPDREEVDGLSRATAGVQVRDSSGTSTRPVGRAASTGSLGAGAIKPVAAATGSSSKMMGRVAVTFVILLALAAGGLFILRGAGSPAGPTKPSATVTFFDSDAGQRGVASGATDSAKVVAQGLGEPGTGSAYYAWLINTSTENITGLGVLRPVGGAYTVSFTPAANSTTSSTNLLSDGSEVEITLEKSAVTVPVGRVVLKGNSPPKTFVHIGHLIVNFPGWPSPLLVGSLLETQRIGSIAQTLKSAVGHNTTTVQCAAQSILDILEGTGASDYRPLPASCAGVNITNTGDPKGYALVGAKAASYTTSNPDPSYLDAASEHAALAGEQSDATSYIKLRVQGAVEAITNTNTALATVRVDALALLTDPANSAKAADLVTFVDRAYQGTGTPSGASVNGPPDALGGGVLVAYEEAQLMATVTLS